MGNVLRPVFGGKRAILKGFIPTDCGENLDQLAEAIKAEKAKADLTQFAKSGSPIVQGTEGPDVA